MLWHMDLILLLWAKSFFWSWQTGFWYINKTKKSHKRFKIFWYMRFEEFCLIKLFKDSILSEVRVCRLNRIKKFSESISDKISTTSFCYILFLFVFINFSFPFTLFSDSSRYSTIISGINFDISSKLLKLLKLSLLYPRF